MAEITEAVLTELEEARKKATPGEWNVKQACCDAGDVWNEWFEIQCNEDVVPINDDNEQYINLLLIHADDLIAEVRRLREENKLFRKGLGNLLRYWTK